jgi:DNA repair photolyase
MNNPIYVPTGKAKEYGDYALNLYTGCPHRCWYCFAPSVLHRDKELFHTNVRPRDGIMDAVKKQFESGTIKDKTIHICFTCDPYPRGYDTTVTREIIQLIKARGNHVQILTKNPIERDFDLLDCGDWYGVSITGERNSFYELTVLERAWLVGINTWISYEPVIDAKKVLFQLEKMLNAGTRSNPMMGHGVHADKIKIGKLNYHPSTINWAEFGREAERICKERGLEYYIKDSLRAEMEKP